MAVGKWSFGLSERLESIVFVNGSRLERIERCAFANSGLKSIQVRLSAIVVGRFLGDVQYVTRTAFVDTVVEISAALAPWFTPLDMRVVQTASVKERFHEPGGILCYVMPPMSNENAVLIVGDLFEPGAIRSRVPDYEGPGRYVSMVTREGVSIKESEWTSKEDQNSCERRKWRLTSE
jgi:hypothetical protein